MRGWVDQFEIGEFQFKVWFDTGLAPGCYIEVYVFQKGEKEALLTCPFYFGEANDRRIRRFARAFSRDSVYRASCLDGTARWARLSRWYEINAQVYWDEILNKFGGPVNNPHGEQMAEAEMERLFYLLRRDLEKLESTPEYQKHLEIEAASPPPSMETLDPGIAPAVHALNSLPGVKTRFSCQGVQRGIRWPGWEYGPIWFPDHPHSRLAYVSFETIPEEILTYLDAFLRDRGVGRAIPGIAIGFGAGSVALVSLSPLDNSRFSQTLLKAAKSLSSEQKGGWGDKNPATRSG